jgi:hypothetical protein
MSYFTNIAVQQTKDMLHYGLDMVFNRTKFWSFEFGVSPIYYGSNVASWLHNCYSHACMLLQTRQVNTFSFSQHTLPNLSWKFCSQAWTTTTAKFTKTFWKITMDGTPGARFSSKLDKCRLIEFLRNLGYSLSNCKYLFYLKQLSTR